MEDQIKKPAPKTPKLEPAKYAGKLIAKKAHSLHQNDHHFEIKEGDDVSSVPEHLLVALRTEGVID